MVAILPESARAVVNSGRLAHVVTLNADGSPQVSCVWIAADGDELVMMHTADHVKVRNLRRDPRVVVSMESDQRSSGGGPYPPFQFHLVIHGTAAIIDGAAPDVAPLICANYGTAPSPDTPPGYVTRITVDRIGGVGPWVTETRDRPAVTLRAVTDADLDPLFDQMRDPESVRMAAFTAADPDDRPAFDAHMARVRSAPDTLLRAIICNGQLVGSAGAFVMEGETEVTYWVDRAAWGRGIASRALDLLLDLVPVRPLYARAASDNARSLRVLRKAGFTIVGTENSFAPGRKATIEETILRKD